MLLAMLKAQWITLVRDRVALFLVFVLPIMFFSVFAVIFGGGGEGGNKPASLKVALLDLDQTKSSRAMADSLKDLSGVTTSDAAEHFEASTESLARADQPESQQPTDKAATADERPTIDEAEILRLVRNNTVDAAVIFPAGLEDSVGDFGGDRPAVKVIYDAANPLAQNMLAGVLQGAAFTAVPDVLLTNGLKQFENFGGPFSAQQQSAVKLFSSMLGPTAEEAIADTEESKEAKTVQTQSSTASSSMSMTDGLIKIETVSAQQASSGKTSKPKTGSMVAYYAASVAVMFLMFSMAGSASALLEYQENGTLERLISGQMTVSKLLFSHWVFFVLCGIGQLFVMFVFASVVFGVDLSNGAVLLGTAVMTVVTTMASASFVIMLATLCRSRKQLESVSTTIILIMSAFGGSMIPRPFLPEFVRETSKLTFNGWALDGFLKVLWYYDPTQNILVTLSTHVLVILLMAAAFLWIATVRAKKWAVA